MAKKLTEEEFRERVKKLFDDKIDISEFVFVNTSTKGKCKCKICGYEWESKPNTLFNGHGCRKCYDQKNSENRKIPLNVIKEKIDENLELIGDYIDTKHKCKTKCKKCGYEWEPMVRDLMNGHGCPNCITIKNSIKKEEKERVRLEKQREKEEIKKKRVEVLVKHNKERTKTIEEKLEYLKTRVENTFGDKITFITGHVNNGGNKFATCHCNVCGYEWITREDRLFKVGGCPKCKSKKEEENRTLKLLGNYKNKAIEKCKDKGLTDIEFFYDKNNKLMVKFYCHNKDIEGKEHGWRTQSGVSFLITFNCNACSRPSRAYTTEEWVKLAKAKFPNFDYSKVNYVDKNTDVTIGCSKHGFFDANPKHFLHKSRLGCPKCAEEEIHNKMVENTIRRGKKVHGDKYIYHPELIFSSTEKIGVECPKHGVFWVTISNHTKNKAGCPDCYSEDYVSPSLMGIEEVEKRCREVHGDKYEYDFSNYKNTSENVTIICPIHGPFEQTMHSHFTGSGCPDCAAIERGLKTRIPWSEALTRMKEAHKYEEYDYTEAEKFYEKIDTKVPIYCKKKFKNGEVHGFFSQSVLGHINGNGCPKCSMSRLEKEIHVLLRDNNIEFEEQYHNKDIIGYKSYDFFLETAKIAIECQGEQHFMPVKYRRIGWTTEKAEENYEAIYKRDKEKYEESKGHGIEVIYYTSKYLYKTYCQDQYLGKVFYDKDELLKYILSKAQNNN